MVVVSTSNPDGTTNLAPVSSAWWLGQDAMLGLSVHSQTSANLVRDGECVLPLLTGTTVVTSARLLADAEASAETLAGTQRRYAAADRSIRAERFVAPDLHSARALRAARIAGVDVDDPASVAAADIRYSRAQHRAWLAGQR